MTSSSIDPREVDPDFGVSLRREWVPAPRYLLRRDRILANLVGRLPDDVVEVGCGAGALLHDLARLGFRCTGLESSEAAVDVARRIHEGSGVTIVSDAQPDAWRGRFGYLIACEVLEHIEADSAALREWVSWLKPGGTAILSVPAHPGLFGASDEWAGHFRRYSRAAFEELARSAGLTPVKLECYGFPVGNVTHRLRNLRARAQGRLATKSANTARSGVDRSVEVSLYGVQTSRLGRLTLRAALAAQQRFLQTDLGEGYLLFAEKR